MKKLIAYLPGDGVGPEVASQAKLALEAIATLYGHTFTFKSGLIGAAAIDATGDPFPTATRKLCLSADAILFGAIGDLKYDNDPSAKIRPEQGLLALRKALGLYANIRPILPFPSLINRSPLKPHIIDSVDFIVIRELIGGVYFGRRGRSADGQTAFDTTEYSVDEIRRVATVAFELASKRRNHLTVVDKANVLETSRLWRDTIQKMAPVYPTVTVDYLFVDNAAMQIIRSPRNFDVIVTDNLFGDILTDEAAVICGSLGLQPSSSIGDGVSLYEPIHGSYPQAAGKDIANPIGSILSSAMLLEGSFGLRREGASIRQAVESTLAAGFGTEDLNPRRVLSTTQLGAKIIQQLSKG